MSKSTEKSTKIVEKKKVSRSINGDYFADFDFSKLTVSVEDMFKNGVHFGHHKSRKNPKMD